VPNLDGAMWVNELFDLKILDPAMGPGGHFLVETVL
jgi:hypothetical protein